MSIVTFAESGHVAVIALNRPEARNAINPDLANALGAAIDRLEGDPNLRVGVLAATITEPKPVFKAGLTAFAQRDRSAVSIVGQP